MKVGNDINFLKETRKILSNHGKTFDDVIFVGDTCTHLRMSVEDFCIEADKEYNDGYGVEEVNVFLILVGKDFWIARRTYDGSEWWEYKEIPQFADYVTEREDKVAGNSVLVKGVRCFNN